MTHRGKVAELELELVENMTESVLARVALIEAIGVALEALRKGCVTEKNLLAAAAEGLRGYHEQELEALDPHVQAPPLEFDS